MKLLIASLLLLSFNAFAIIGNIGHSTNLDYAKAVIPESVEKLFINVKASEAISSGMVAGLDLTADDGASVVKGTTTGLAPLCIMVNDCASGALCKCQTYGLFSSALFDVTTASAVAGKRAFMATQSTGYLAARNTDLASEVPVGYFYDAASVSGSVEIFIKL